jgi:hypothetical protein
MKKSQAERHHWLAALFRFPGSNPDREIDAPHPARYRRKAEKADIHPEPKDTLKQLAEAVDLMNSYCPKRKLLRHLKIYPNWLMKPPSRHHKRSGTRSVSMVSSKRQKMWRRLASQ